MSIQASGFIATSRDGFIARNDGSLDWLDAANETVPDGEDCGYNEFMASIDCLVMGRNTYEKVLDMVSPDMWPYGDTPVVVLSRNPMAIPEVMTQTVSHSSESPRALCHRLEQAGMKRLYIDGGVTIQRFMAEGLIDYLTITLIPVVLGSGIPLFGDLQTDVQLNHVATRSYEFGFVQLQYEVRK